jgi:2-polyprenyl-3-methyl-5-hydroxy-6-metoxy-1,4-benzoquinol methylase
MPRACRFCYVELKHTFIDLGMSPLSNSYLNEKQLNLMEAFFPLHAYVCEKCKLVQLEEFETPENIFKDYAYFSSYSESWLAHAKNYTEMMTERFSLSNESFVVEIASNDGYLLQYFKEKNIPVMGIEPAINVAEMAIKKGIDTQVVFFGIGNAEKLSKEIKKADVIVANNVLAHVPDINDFVAGLKIFLADEGVITIEFPHLMELIDKQQFDTIYHEHFSYLSLTTVEKIFNSHGLKIIDVEQLSTHGGSLRVFVCHEGDSSKHVTQNISKIKKLEDKMGLNELDVYLQFSNKIKKNKRLLLDFLIKLKNENKSIVAYGAPAKGNTLLNYCGIRTDFIDYTVDKSPHKQGLFLPGTHIPIYSPEYIYETRPDYILILPWNLEEEIVNQLAYTKEWGCKLIIPIPDPRVVA